MAVNPKGQIIRVGAGGESVEKWLNANLDQIQRALPKMVDGTRLARIFATEIQRVPKLLQCSSASLIGGFLQVSHCGLEIGSHLGQAWLIPFKVKGTMTATVVFGYKGLVALAYRSGIVQNVQAWDVRDADIFEPPMMGTDPKIVHSPQPKREESEVVAAYAVVRLLNAPVPNIEWMWRDEIERIMRRSRAFQYADGGRNDSPWHTDFPMMARKTALRRALKYVPQTPESRTLHTAINIDEQADANLDQTFDIGEAVIDIPTDLDHDPAAGEMSEEEERRVFGDDS
jgi:recombination protein RecT